MSRYAAVVFDLDGTLIDTERLVIEAAMVVLKRRGIAVERSFMTSLVGVAEEEGLQRLHRTIGPGHDLAGFNADWSREIRAAYARGIPLMAGVDQVLSHLSGRNLPRAVATNSGTESARRKLGEAGIAHHFRDEHVVGFDLVARPKPSPDVFLAAADRLGVAPARCLAFEDSDTGVIAALAAGMTVVQVPDMHPAGTRDAHHLAQSMIEGARAAGLID